jgi:hypothetical protein
VGVYRFEDLRVWQAAKKQSDEVGELLQRPAFQRDRELSHQMNDAALSVLFNITEGFLRRKNGETAQFLRYAFASKRVSGISCVGHSMRSDYAPQTEKPDTRDAIGPGPV